MIGLVAMLGSAQLVRVLPQDMLLLMIGLPVVLFFTVQLLGCIGGFSGV